MSEFCSARMMFASTVIALCWAISAYTVGCEPETIRVRAPVGEIIGKVSEVTVSKRRGFVREFLGIPYAVAPEGDLRFQKPEMKQPFRLPFNATQGGSICPQAGLQVVPMNDYTVSEDCLNLNIYTPHPYVKGSRIPVLVYIHGGAFVTGAANFYVGDVLSYFGDVIVVTINYRLSIFGFLSTHDKTAVGNYGLWDQHLALRWVNRNIASFGGDPSSVTLIGQSVGAISAIYQALYVGNKGLIHRVISESGTAVNFGSLYTGPVIHDINYRTIGHMIGCSTMTSYELISCLKRKDESTILSSLHMSFYQIPFGPVFDGEFIRDDPRVMLDKTVEKYADVRDFFGSLDLLIGGNSMEGAIYISFMWKALLMVNDVETFNITEKRFKEKVIPSVLQQIYGSTLSELARDAVFMRYSSIMNEQDDVTLRNMLLKLTTDYMFKIPNLKTAMLHSNLNSIGNTFVYEFLTKPSLTFQKYVSPSWVAEANHGDEVEFVFGFSRKMLDALSVSQDYRPSSKERELSYKMMKLWTNFAKTGFPNTPDTVPGCPIWKQFDSQSKSYLELSTDMSARSSKTGYAEPSASFWLDFMPRVAPSITLKMAVGREPETTEDTCESKMAERGLDETKIAIVVLSIVAGMLGIGFIVSVYCGLNVRKKTNTTYDAVEM